MRRALGAVLVAGLVAGASAEACEVPAGFTPRGRLETGGIVVLFHMPGRWQLSFDVEGGGRRTRLATDVIVE